MSIDFWSIPPIFIFIFNRNDWNSPPTTKIPQKKSPHHRSLRDPTRRDPSADRQTIKPSTERSSDRRNPPVKTLLSPRTVRSKPTATAITPRNTHQCPEGHRDSIGALVVPESNGPPSCRAFVGSAGHLEELYIFYCLTAKLQQQQNEQRRQRQRGTGGTSGSAGRRTNDTGVIQLVEAASSRRLYKRRICRYPRNESGETVLAVVCRWEGVESRETEDSTGPR